MKRPVILDTNVVSEAMSPNPNSNVVDWLISTPVDRLHLTTITVGELLFGVALLPEGHRKRAYCETIARTMEYYQNRTFAFDASAAIAYADVRAKRQRAGRPVSTQDAQIAAIARANGCAVATRNVKDFEDAGIPLINPWETPASS